MNSLSQFVSTLCVKRPIGSGLRCQFMANLVERIYVFQNLQVYLWFRVFEWRTWSIWLLQKIIQTGQHYKAPLIITVINNCKNISNWWWLKTRFLMVLAEVKCCKCWQTKYAVLYAYVPCIVWKRRPLHGIPQPSISEASFLQAQKPCCWRPNRAA